MGTVRYELPRRPHSVSGGHRYPEGAKVPGYAGFVPGVASGNLIAVATPRAARQGFHPDSSKVVLKSSRVDPSRMPSAGNCRASNYNRSYLQDMPYSQEDVSSASIDRDVEASLKCRGQGPVSRKEGGIAAIQLCLRCDGDVMVEELAKLHGHVGEALG